jgi:D-tagatose 6-phosphate 4-epimerase
VAEATARSLGQDLPLYIIGTEVPPPGGADHELTMICPTSPEAARQTLNIHRTMFDQYGLQEAFTRVIGLVVQPGVEFGNHNVIHYAPNNAHALTSVLADEPQFVFEAHSTDYQGFAPLAQLVRDGFEILKVGPELTFVLRETLYGLDLIASDLLPDYGTRPLYGIMEELMLAEPGHWASHYSGSGAETRMLRHYSLSDRIRYYWTSDVAQSAVTDLINALRGQSIPLPLFRQHLPDAAEFANAPLDPEGLLIFRIMRSLQTYHEASALQS